jgi:serine/threonine protein phosphatase 1
MAILAIGDVHGNSAALEDLLRQLQSEVGPDDVVVFLGDYVDRGPNTRECVEHIIALQQDMPGRVVCLCGNHDDWFLRTLRDYRHHTWLLSTDAFTTIRSYSVAAADALREAVVRAGAAVHGGECALPYELFFRMPAD